MTSDEVLDPQNLELWLTVNNQKQQDSNTSNMIFGIRLIQIDS